MSKFGTTTFANRHEEKLGALKACCIEKNISNPTIIEVGPGGIVSLFFTLWQAGHRKNLSSGKKVKRVLGRCLENSTRRLGLFRLKTSEPYEIVEVFHNLSPREMIIIDKQDKILNDLQQHFRSKPLSLPVTTKKVNIETQSILNEGDIVIAYFIIERCTDKDAAIDNLFKSVRLNGVLSTTYKRIIPPDNFTIIAEGLFHRYK